MALDILLGLIHSVFEDPDVVVKSRLPELSISLREILTPSVHKDAPDRFIPLHTVFSEGESGGLRGNLLENIKSHRDSHVGWLMRWLRDIVNVSACFFFPTIIV